MRQGEGLLYTLDAPVLGLMDKVPLPKIPEGFAIELDNLFPDSDGVSLRPGTERITDVAVTGGVFSVFSHNQVDGTHDVIIAGNNDLYEVDIDAGTKSSIKGSTTITGNQWQSFHFNGRLFIANGLDKVLSRSIGTDFADAGFTIEGSPDDNFVNIGSYKEHLFFCKKDASEIYYTQNPEAISGALLSYDPGLIYQYGGSTVFCGSSSQMIKDRNSETCVMVSSQGEVLVFSGSTPSSSTWNLVGHYFFPEPLGYKSFVYRGSLLTIITEEGLIPITELSGSREFNVTGKYTTTTDNIDKRFVRLTKAYGALYGWCALNYPRLNMLIVNVPTTATTSIQLVMNSLTGAWCRFTGIDATCWTKSNKRAYFGSSDGHLYRFGEVKADGVNELDSETGTAISFRGATAFTDCGSKGINKTFPIVRPVLYIDAGSTIGIGVSTDYNRSAEVSPIAIEKESSGAPWDEAEWDTATWEDGQEVVDNWVSTEGSGRTVSVLFSGELKNVDMQILEFNIQHHQGGILR